MLRWNVEHYGDGDDEWSVYESPGGDRTEPFPSILTWLTEGQARAIAEMLNDYAGYDWQTRHPEWSDK